MRKLVYAASASLLFGSLSLIPAAMAQSAHGADGTAMASAPTATPPPDTRMNDHDADDKKTDADNRSGKNDHDADDRRARNDADDRRFDTNDHRNDHDADDRRARNDRDADDRIEPK